MTKPPLILFAVIPIILFFSCRNTNSTQSNSTKTNNQSPTLIVLGTVQDGGSPHIGCSKSCCTDLFGRPDASRMVVSLGVIDPPNKKRILFEATPDIVSQMKILKSASNSQSEMPTDIFLTHAHIGHYAGLMYLGREAFSSHMVITYAMPRMIDFLNRNGPWNNLIKNNNIDLQRMKSDSTQLISSNISVTPFSVPHRDEYSETVGFKIKGPSKSAIFIPDIDKWKIWDKSIIDLIDQVDLAFIDATFYDENELPNRNMSEIPHPFVIESMNLFDHLDSSFKNKIYFIHLNHTNPLLNEQSREYQLVVDKGYHIAKSGEQFQL